MAPKLEEAVHQLRGSPHVADVRNQGLVAGIELAARPDAIGARGFETFLKCFEHNVLVRSTGDIIALAPALIVEEAQIDEMVGTLKKVLATVQ